MRYWGNNMMNNWGSRGGGSFGLFGSVMSLLFWAAVIIGIVFLVRWMINQGKQNTKGEDAAMKILRERYAKGEIAKEEFEARKKDLAG